MTLCKLVMVPFASRFAEELSTIMLELEHFNDAPSLAAHARALYMASHDTRKLVCRSTVDKLWVQCHGTYARWSIYRSYVFTATETKASLRLNLNSRWSSLQAPESGRDTAR